MTKTTKIIFTISLILNLALIGVIAGGVYKKAKRHMPPAELSLSSREMMRENIENSKKTMRADFKKMKQHRDDLEDIMLADSFDIEAYNMVVERILDAKDRIAREKSVVMGKTLAQLPLAERKKFAGHVLRSLSHKHGKKPPFDRDGRGPEKDG